VCSSDLVPFEFAVDNAVLPAGTYRITSDTNDPTLLYINSLDGRHNAIALVAESVPNSDATVEVAFKQYGKAKFLWKIAVPGDDAVELLVPQAEVAKVLSNAHGERTGGR
jgi:hypothetical protein